MLLRREAKLISTPSSKYLPIELRISIGAPVVLTYNMEQRAGLCNGSKGTVFDIIPDDETPIHQPIVLVRMEDYKGPSFLPTVKGIIPVISRTVALNTAKDGPYRISRTALPLRLGFATTIHKIQGRTCDAVVFDPTSLKSSALAYVALSRVRERTHMFITTAMTSQQLSKSDRARLLDDTEDTRVHQVEQDSLRLTHELVSSAKAIASTHNMMSEYFGVAPTPIQ